MYVASATVSSPRGRPVPSRHVDIVDTVEEQTQAATDSVVRNMAAQPNKLQFDLEQFLEKTAASELQHFQNHKPASCNNRC